MLRCPALQQLADTGAPDVVRCEIVDIRFFSAALRDALHGLLAQPVVRPPIARACPAAQRTGPAATGGASVVEGRRRPPTPMDQPIVVALALGAPGAIARSGSSPPGQRPPAPMSTARIAASRRVRSLASSNQAVSSATYAHM